MILTAAAAAHLQRCDRGGISRSGERQLRDGYGVGRTLQTNTGGHPVLVLRDVGGSVGCGTGVLP